MKKTLLFGALFVSAMAQAQAPSRSASRGSLDPNQTICRTITEIGSRLARARVCMTRQQWEQYRRETRQEVEQAQMRRQAE